jgi:transmembrane sensor
MPDDNLERSLVAARRAAPSWSLSRQQQTIWGVGGRLTNRRKTTKKLAVGSAITLAVAGLGVVGGRAFIARDAAPRTGLHSAAAATTKLSDKVSSWRLKDGSQILLDGPETMLRRTLEAKAEVAFELDAGGAEFDVAHRPERAFRVHAGAVTVSVLGTSFRVARKSARSEVSVSRGLVLVSWPGGSRKLAAGEMGLFPPPDATVAAEASELAKAKDRVEPRAPVVANAREDELNQRSAAEALFARADKARSGGQPERAVTHLRAITDQYPSDPRAPMAAFTRGRLLLEALGKPAEAAAAFAQARRLAARGTPLAEDALAREVDALRAAGQSGRARERAELYRKLHPNGIRLQAVMRAGGLQAEP